MQTLRRLEALGESGRPVTAAVFPDADHGMYEFETLADGERESTRQPDGYLQMMQDFIEGKPRAASYGNAQLRVAGPWITGSRSPERPATMRPPTQHP